MILKLAIWICRRAGYLTTDDLSAVVHRGDLWIMGRPVKLPKGYHLQRNPRRAK